MVVGGSIAGCTAARLFALGGASVAVIERRANPDAYKVACTHQIQSSATATIERLGFGPLLDARGAVRAVPEAWSPHGGVIQFSASSGRAIGVTRRTLDPILRELAATTPGVELLPGWSVTALRGDRSRPAGVEIETPSHGTRSLSARLVVAADGRHSTVARLAGVPGRVRPNNRFAYFAYFRGIRPRIDRPRVWFLDPDAAAVFPNEDDLSLIAVVPHRSRLGEFRRDPGVAYRRAVAEIPEGPELEGAERASKLIGSLDVPNLIRPPARPGLAFIGDAALTADPLFGVGCGWAFQTAEWLVDQTLTAVCEGGHLDRALGRYRRAFFRRLVPHHLLIADYSTGRRLRASERLAFRAAANDPRVARAVEATMSRSSSPLRLLDPRLGPGLLRAR